MNDHELPTHAPIDAVLRITRGYIATLTHEVDRWHHNASHTLGKKSILAMGDQAETAIEFTQSLLRDLRWDHDWHSREALFERMNVSLTQYDALRTYLRQPGTDTYYRSGAYEIARNVVRHEKKEN